MAHYKLRECGVPLTGHKFAQAQVLHINGVRALVSYSTTVARLNSDGWLEVDMLCSTTTRKHIGWFLKEYCRNVDGYYPTFNIAKMCVQDKVRYNIYTGEIQHR